jgi:putative aldouronate transport system substrate-binding protein
MDKKQGEANTMFDDCGVKSGIPAIVWCNDADIITEFTDLKTTIDNYVKQSYTQFILGTLDINDDAAWQTYLTELDNMGLERYLDVCEQYYFGK